MTNILAIKSRSHPKKGGWQASLRIYHRRAPPIFSGFARRTHRMKAEISPGLSLLSEPDLQRLSGDSSANFARETAENTPRRPENSINIL